MCQESGMVAEGTDIPPSRSLKTPVIPIRADQIADPQWYISQIALTLAQEQADEITPLKAKQRLEFLNNAYTTITNEDISDAASRVLSPIERLDKLALIEHTDEQLAELEIAITEIGQLNPKKKARWLDFIARTRKLQTLAKSKAIYNWIYIGRTSEDNKVFRMGKIHTLFFEVWESEVQHSLIMAPPSHGKTVSTTGQMLWDIKHNPRVRILLWSDTEDKAKKQLQLVKRYINCKRWKALYPNIRVMREKQEDSAKRFTISRDNIGSREPTMEAAGTISLINGDGYDIIYVDDPCPETVASQESTRRAINYKFDTVVSMRFRKKEISRFRMICTPWHPEDLAGHIISSVRAGQRSGWKIAFEQFSIKKDNEGRHVPLWPERYDSDYYRDKEQTLHADDYARLFELKFSAQTTKLVQSVKFYPCDPEDPLLSEYPEDKQKWFRERIDAINSAEQWLSIDPSATAGKHSAECAATQISLTVQNKAYVRESWFFPGNPVEMQEWIVDRIINHGIHRVLIENQGAQAGQVTLWVAYIYRRLRELGVHWNGSIVTCKTQNRGGGQNIGKRMRLKQCAALIQNGYLRFPGKIMRNWQRGAELYFGCVDNTNVRKLIRQIVDFPLGTCDGVDTITQFIMENEARLQTNSQEPNFVVIADEVYDSLREGKARAIKEQLRPTDRDAERESEWLSGCLG